LVYYSFREAHVFYHPGLDCSATSVLSSDAFEWSGAATFFRHFDFLHDYNIPFEICAYPMRPDPEWKEKLAMSVRSEYTPVRAWVVVL